MRRHENVSDASEKVRTSLCYELEELDKQAERHQDLSTKIKIQCQEKKKKKKIFE